MCNTPSLFVIAKNYPAISWKFLSDIFSPACRKVLESIGLFNKNLVGALKATLVKDVMCAKGVEKSFEILCPSFVTEVRCTPYSNFISVKIFSGDKLFPWETVTLEN